jgi:hypothetical protein
MVGQPAPRPVLLTWLRWPAAAFLALALLCLVSPAAHASTHAAAHTCAHLADNNQGGNQGGNDQGGNNQGGNHQGGGTATPELPSGALLGLALVPAALIMLRRHRRRAGSVASR